MIVNKIDEVYYFMTNKEWYRTIVDGLKIRLELTDKAPKEAIDSFKKYKENEEKVFTNKDKSYIINL